MLMFKDANGEVIPVGRSIQTNDGTATPQTSPLTITTGATIDITIPTNAAELVMTPNANMQISEDNGVIQYYETDETVNIGVAGMSHMYVKNAGTASVTLQFYFVMV